MEAEGVESLRVDGVTFSPVEQVYGQINDRRLFVQWELERWFDSLRAVIGQALVVKPHEDESDVLTRVTEEVIGWTMNGPELVEWREVSDVLNQLVRQRLDDGEELPPGVGVRPRTYVSQRVS
jgi:hypothetical protein